MSPTTRRKSSQAIAIGAVSALAIALTGCSSDEAEAPENEYAQICVDEETQQRVEDKECEDTSHSHSNHSWMWLPFFLGNNRYNSIPAVGNRVGSEYQGQRQNPSDTNKNARSSTVSRDGMKDSEVKKSKSSNSKKSGTTRGGFGKKGGGSGS